MKPRYKTLTMLIRMSNIQKKMFKSNEKDKNLKVSTTRIILFPEKTQKKNDKPTGTN
jgi:hypothetical protein